MTPDDADQPPMPQVPTTPNPLPEELDELVSAVLDGEASTDDVARVAADPVLSARLDELRAVAAAVAEPVVAPPDLGALVAAAVATADQPTQYRPTHDQPTHDQPARDPRHAEVVSLDARRRSRTRLLMTAAAVVLVALLAVPLLRSRSSDELESANRFSSVGTSINGAEGSSDDDAPEDAAAPEADAGGDAAAAGEAANDGAPRSAPTTVSPSTLLPTAAASGTQDLGDLGEHAGTATLVEVVRSIRVTEFAADAVPAALPAGCAALASTLDPPSDIRSTGTAVVAGDPVTVLVVTPSDPALAPLVVVASAECTTVIDQQPLSP